MFVRLARRIVEQGGLPPLLIREVDAKALLDIENRSSSVDVVCFVCKVYRKGTV